MATIERDCERCGKRGAALVGQSLSTRGLAWHLHFSCTRCGSNIEADGGTVAPEDVRQAIIDEDGLWLLEVLEPLESRTKLHVLKALREYHSLCTDDISALKQNIPGLVCRGTRLEMEDLQRFLHQHGALVRVSRTPDPGES